MSKALYGGFGNLPALGLNMAFGLERVTLKLSQIFLFKVTS
jgi:hypothetical protein